VRCPKRTTFARVLVGVDAALLEQVLLLWQEQVLGPVQDRLVIFDGKEIRPADVESVSAVSGMGRWLGSTLVQTGSNEIPAARELLGKLDLVDKLLLADAAHTQVATVQQILYEQGGDYLLTVKENQKNLFETLATLLTQQRFSPSAQPPDQGAQAGTQPQPFGNPLPALPGSDSLAGGFSGSSAGGATGDSRQTQGPSDQEKEMGPGSGFSAQQPDAGTTPGQGDALAQARLLGGGKPPPPLFRHQSARG